MPAARGQQRGGGVTAIHVWLIAFVALWLISTVLLVWLYTDQERLKKTTGDAQASYSTAQSDMRELRTSKGRIAELAVGSADDDDATVQSKVESFYARIRDERIVSDAGGFDDPSSGLLSGMRALYEAYVGEQEARAAAEDRAQSLANQVETLTADKTDRDQAFAEKVDDLVGQIATMEGAHTEYRQDRDREIDGVEALMQEAEQEAARNIQEQRTIANEQKQELDEYKSRYKDLQDKIGELQIKPSPLMTARQGDGLVLTAKPGEEVVYISLGRRHKITLGMVFAVYSGDQDIPADGRAKARIEVVRVFEGSAECVIREVFGRSMVVDGDVINNPIYDKDRALTFVVAGRFDFDGDGLDDADGADQVEALIRNWGGNVADDITARVDFLVAGDTPPRPSSLEDLSPEQAERQEEIGREFEVHQRAVEVARALSVPILTQDVFLHFLGYAGRDG